MSTGLNCEIIEVEPEKWYYILEHGSAPKNAWDWYEYASAYGPFGSYDAATAHLHDNHANPGGYWKIEYDETKPPLAGTGEHADLLRRLIAEATNPVSLCRGVGFPTARRR